MKTSCIVIVGKPGAGKSSIGSELAKLLGGAYISLGGFMREVMHIPDPHIGVDKNVVYEKLHDHLTEGLLVLDCHPYPAEDLEALQTFISRPTLELRAVVHVQADDEVALNRLKKRLRPGQTCEERLQYFNDNQRFIDMLLAHPRAIHVENNIDFDDMHTFRHIAEEIARRL